MAKGFLKSKSYCDQCPLEYDIKVKKIERISEKNRTQFTSDNTGKIDILFLTDTIEHEDLLEKLNKYIQNLGVKNYAIVPAIGCKTKHFLLPSPTYATYTYCKSFNIEKYNPKVVVTLGRALFYFTKGSVFSSWREFKEFIFNDTFFYPHIKSKWKGRIYPVGFLSEIFDFSSFENHFFKFQIQAVLKHIENYENEKFIMPEYTIQVVEDYVNWLTTHKAETKGSFDTETNNLNVFVDDFKVGCIQCSFDGKTAYVLPFNIIEKRSFSNWLKNIYQIWANGKYDCKALNRVRVSGHHVDEDIPLIYHILNTERESNSIKVLSWFIGFGGYEDELDDYIKKYKISNYLDIPPHILYPYAGIDAIVTYLLEKNLSDRLIARQPEVYNMYRKIILPVIPVFQKIEEEGLLIDQNYVQEYHNTIISQLQDIEEKIYKLLNKKINISSIDELGKALEDIGLPNYGRTKKGLYKTGEENLTQWKNEGYEVAELLLRYRALAKLDSTYIGTSTDKERSGIYQYIMSDGKVHGNIMPALTDSLRSLSFSPNLQNFPKQGPEGKAFRKIFIAPEEYIICEADYSGFQLRLMGIYSNDKNMIHAFSKIGDLHSVTGNSIFCNDISLDYFIEHKKEEPYKTARFNGKTTNLAFAFCQTPYSFQNKIRDEWTEKHIEEYIKNNKLKIIVNSKTGEEQKNLTVATEINRRYFETYPQLKEYQTARQQKACEQGYVDCSVFPGARRHLPELVKISDNLDKERNSYYSTLKKIAVNAEAQSGEALNIYIALRKIYDEIENKRLRSKLIGCVHDSIVLYIHRSEIEVMYYILKNSMERFDYIIPIVAEIEIGKIWGFGEEITEANVKNFLEK